MHAASIEVARRRAAEAGVEDRVTFEVADAAGYAGSYDVIAFFDALHDLGDPVGAARHARAALAPDGTCLVVEPFAGDRIEDNLTPVGRFFYGMSTLVCTPGSLSQAGRAGLGRRRARRACAVCCSKAGSRPSAARRRPRSTSSSRPAVSRSSRRTPAGGPP